MNGRNEDMGVDLLRLLGEIISRRTMESFHSIRPTLGLKEAMVNETQTGIYHNTGAYAPISQDQKVKTNIPEGHPLASKILALVPQKDRNGSWIYSYEDIVKTLNLRQFGFDSKAVSNFAIRHGYRRHAPGKTRNGHPRNTRESILSKMELLNRQLKMLDEEISITKGEGSILVIDTKKKSLKEVVKEIRRYYAEYGIPY